MPRIISFSHLAPIPTARQCSLPVIYCENNYVINRVQIFAHSYNLTDTFTDTKNVTVDT